MTDAVDQGSFELNRPPAESEPDGFGGASDRPIPTGEERSEIEHEQLLRSAAAIAGDQLRDATQHLFERMAEQHGISVEGARLAALYSHAELIRMAARREREALA